MLGRRGVDATDFTTLSSPARRVKLFEHVVYHSRLVVGRSRHGGLTQRDHGASGQSRLFLGLLAGATLSSSESNPYMGPGSGPALPYFTQFK